MWIFSKIGFFSVVEHKDDPDLVMVRARYKEDIDRLHHAIMDFSKVDLPVERTLNADYYFRMTIPKMTWARIMEAVAADIDYTNFKNAVHHMEPGVRAKAYMEVWDAMRRSQDVAFDPRPLLG